MENRIVTVNIDFKLLKDLGFEINEEFKKAVIGKTLMYTISQLLGAPIANALANMNLADESNRTNLMRSLADLVKGIEDIITVEEGEDEAVIMFRLPASVGAMAHALEQIVYSLPIIVSIATLLEERMLASEKFRKYVGNIIDWDFLLGHS